MEKKKDNTNFKTQHTYKQIPSDNDYNSGGNDDGDDNDIHRMLYLIKTCNNKT